MLHISLDGLINPSKLIALIKELLGVCLENEKVNLGKNIVISLYIHVSMRTSLPLTSASPFM